MPSSLHGIFKAGLASKSQRIDSYVRHKIFCPYHSPAGWCPSHRSSKKTLQPHSAIIWTSSQNNARHDPKNGQARKQTHYPSVFEALGRRPSRNFIQWHAEDWRKKASGTTLIIACLSPPCLTVSCNHSSPTASSASVKEGLYPR